MIIILLISSIILICITYIWNKRFIFYERINLVFYPTSLKPLKKDVFLPSLKEEMLEGDEVSSKEDNLSFIGIDDNGNKILLKISSCLQENSSEVFVTVFIEGKLYSTLSKTKTVAGKWNANRLKFELVEPMRIWRVSFNGPIRSSENTYHHIRINFIWRAFCNPYIYEPHGNLTKTSFCELNIDGYEQWGSIVGQISLDFDFVGDYHFKSLRKRYWSSKKWTSMIGFLKDGTMFSIGTPNCTKKKQGHIRFSNGNITEVTSNFLDMSSFLSLTTIELFGKTEYLLNLTYNLENKFCSKYLNITSFEGLLNKQHVEGFFEIWFSNSTPEAGPIKKDNAKLNEILLLPLESPLCKDSQIVGGKGASLAMLTDLQNSSSIDERNFTVPQGFCLTNKGIELQIQSSPNLKAAIMELLQVHSTNEIAETCLRIQNEWLSTKICTEIECVISTHISLNTPYAVRSSGLTEDTLTTSSAGQNLTILGCINLESILVAVQHCWASLYSLQSVQYRRMNGLPIQSGMGVVIQKVVAAEISGVIFTCDPLTGNPFNTVINANYGLGETVVSGEVEPDSILVERKNSPTGFEYFIKSEQCGKKTHQLSMTANGIIVKMNLDEISSKMVCISHDEALFLAKLGIFLEEEFSNPCDIEWAILDGMVFLLQCRPITTLHSWTDFELLHEHDSALIPNDVISKANTGEVLPGATSLLTQSLNIKAIDIAILYHANDKFHVSNYINNLTTVTSSHHVFINMFNTLLYKIGKTRSAEQTAIELAVCGHVLINDSVHKSAVLRNGIASNWSKIKLTLRALNNMWWADSLTKQAERDALNFSIDFNGCNTANQLFNLIDDNIIQIDKIARLHSLVSQVNVFWQIVLLTVLLEGKKDLVTEHFEDISNILQGLNGVASAEIPSDIENIARKISECADADKFVTIPSNLAKHWMNVHCPVAAQLLSKFLIFHGHRSVKDLDFATETWAMNSNQLFVHIQNIVKGGLRNQQNGAKTFNIDEVTRKLKTPQKSFTRTILSYIFPFCRKSTERREVTKNSYLLVINTFRIAFKRLGNLLANENYLTDPKLIFYCSYYELKKLLMKKEPIILQKARRRQRLWETWNSLKFPELTTGIPQPETLILENSKITDDRKTAKGTLVYPGYVEGRACVILNSRESADIKSGDILITVSTDVGWTPVFPLLSGIVTELGGLISHGAVVAREYGVPCIVGVPGATSLFSTGDRIVLDGPRSSIYTL